ncbi:MAG TPA: hypothetical protein VG389_22285 [Myxococcota bacterium]|jgi:hypothetical protein|nr:hypothetical protein [Myxococcota bacterium]
MRNALEGARPGRGARAARLAAVIWTVAGVAGGCHCHGGGGGPGDECRTNGDCDPGLFCNPQTLVCEAIGTDGGGTDSARDSGGSPSDSGATDGGLPGDGGPGIDSTVPGADSTVPGTDSAVTGPDSGPPVCTCNDGNVCTDDTCDAIGACVFTPNTLACSDGNACSMGDTCGGGTCNPGGFVNCDDGNTCTDDFCAPSIGCNYMFNTDPCDDGDACTTGDTCSIGVCVPAAPLVCADDGNPCTDDACDPGSGCVYPFNSDPCDDGSACTSGDACSAGACNGTLVSCNDGLPATFDFCDPAVGCQNVAGTCFADNFDAGAVGTPWTFSAVDDGSAWHYLLDPDTVSNVAAAPPPGGTGCAASPPDFLPAFSGDTTLWYGATATGNYSATMMCLAGTGGTTGNATSPVFVVPGGSTPELHFWTWWEIECSVPASFDVMTVQVSVASGPFTTVRTINTGLQACLGFGANDGLSNGGASFAAGTPSTPNVDGFWQEVVVALPAAPAFDTTAQLRFVFNSSDALQNYFRGWSVDTVWVDCP